MGEIIETHVQGNFTGWKHGTQFQLVNGQVWEQESPDYFYYHYHGIRVTIEAEGSVGVMSVAGIPQTVTVRRVR